MKLLVGAGIAAGVLVLGSIQAVTLVASSDDDPAPSSHARPAHPLGKATPGPKHKADKPKKAEQAEGDDDKGSPNGHAAPGRAHAQAMKAWTKCVGEHADGAKAMPGPAARPKDACGTKPAPPGRAKRAH